MTNKKIKIKDIVDNKNADKKHAETKENETNDKLINEDTKELKTLNMSTKGHIPFYGSLDACGIDLKYNLEKPVTIKAGEAIKIDTGIRVEIPKNNFGLIVPRSSTGCKHNLSLLNTVGIIDSDYRGDLITFVKNNGDKDFTVNDGDRLFQLIIIPFTKCEINIINEDDLSETERGEGALGSTGN